MMQQGNGVSAMDQQRQYQMHPMQQWMMPPQSPQAQPPPAAWNPSPLPPPQSQAQVLMAGWNPAAVQTQPQIQQQMMAQQYYSQYQMPQTAAAGPGSSEIRSLWIGDLQPWMEENYLVTCFNTSGQVQAVSAKVIRNKQTGQPEGYGFIEFVSRDAAEKALQTYTGTPMPSSEQNFRLNWATLGAGERRADDGADYTVFVGDLAPEVTDYVLQETFRAHYISVKGAKVVTDRNTGRSKGYGFVRFMDESEQIRAMSEMNGTFCSSRPMRIGPAATKKTVGTQQFDKAPYQNTQGSLGESDPTNTTIFVGGVDESVTDEHLRQLFSPYGQLVHVKIPAGKRCGFVQFADRSCAEQALSVLNGTQLGGLSIRLSWGRTPSNKQGQADQTQYSGGYYGYGQGGYGYTAPPQDPNMYYSGYPGYGNYQQPQQ